ncbi:MAG: LytR C-terminal domain-containing protein [Bacteroidota bacterium]|nr:LytR C-terminal domain-containing protein [Bacteroidota bacterium]MDP4231399.1 LytR C-terminal domain-containing protein [Bacteroidota bacterium]
MAKFSLRIPFKSRSKRKGRSRSQKFSSLFLWITSIGAATVVVLLGWQFISRMWVKPPVSSTRERSDLLVRAGEHIQLTVMNGSGAANAARAFTDFLRARKFDVVEMTNYKEKNVEHTFIIDKVLDTVAAQKVAYALGISAMRITHEPDSNAFVDAAVVIGKDYINMSPMK